MIAARSKIPRSENRTWRDLSFQVEIILHHIGELRMISRREGIYQLG